MTAPTLTDRAARQAVRDAQRFAAMQERDARRLAAERNPATQHLRDAAHRIRAALVAHTRQFPAKMGTGPLSHCITIPHAIEAERGAVDSVAQRAANPLCADVRLLGTSWRIEVKEDRALLMRERDIDRNGEWGHLIVVNKDGVLETQYSQEASPPLRTLGYE